MEKDPNIRKIIREAGLVSAPEQFTDQVIGMVHTEPQNTEYKPIIGRVGRILIILFILGLVAITIIYARPGGRLLELQWQLPEINFRLNFLSELNIPTGLLAALGAFFILVFSDANLTRKRLV